jgi:hypothetical protein
VTPASPSAQAGAHALLAAQRRAAAASSGWPKNFQPIGDDPDTDLGVPCIDGVSRGSLPPLALARSATPGCGGSRSLTGRLILGVIQTDAARRYSAGLARAVLKN